MEKIKCLKIIQAEGNPTSEEEVYIKDILFFIRIHHSGQNGFYLEFRTNEGLYQIRTKDNAKFRTTMLKKIKEQGEEKRRFVQTGYGGDGQKLGYYKYWKELVNPFL